MLGGVYREPVFIKEAQIPEVRSYSMQGQSEFINAIQIWDLERILELLESGEVNPYQEIIPSEGLAKKLFAINNEKRFIPYPDETEVDLRQFIDDCTLPAWVLISIFSDGVRDGGLKTQVFTKLQEIVGDNYEKKHQELSDQVKKRRGSVDVTPSQDVFNDSYRKQLELLALEDKEAIKKLNTKD